jgi:hypothetical protein
MLDIQSILSLTSEKNNVHKTLKCFFDAGRATIWNEFINLANIPKRVVDEPINEYFFRLSRVDHHCELVEALGFIAKETMSPITQQKLDGLTHILARTLPDKMAEKLMSDNFEIKDIVQTAYFVGYVDQLVVSLAALNEYLKVNKDIISEPVQNCIKGLQNELRKKYDIRPLISLAESKPA